MDNNQRDLLQAAILIHEQLALRRARRRSVYLPDHTWRSMARLLRQSESAQRRGWYWANAQVQAELLGEVERCQDQLAHVVSVLQRRAAWRPIPSQRELYEELRGLRLEFGQSGRRLDPDVPCVTTGPVILNGIHLGRFEIRLESDRLPDSDAIYCFRIVAMEPHPAANNPGVTHPHVQNERLCLGSAFQATELALIEGRLMDAFLIVAQILGTYTLGSAFVELVDWERVPCGECGDLVPVGKHDRCQTCNKILCEPCSNPCPDCACLYCFECLKTCDAYGKSVCRQCRVGRRCGSCRAVHQFVRL